MSEKPTKKTPIKTAVRIPPDIRADIEDAAAREGHSMNKEIMDRLSAGMGGASLHTLAEQNRQLRADIKHLEMLVQSIIAAISPRR